MDPKAERASALITQLTPLFDEADRSIVVDKLTKNEKVLLALGEHVLRQDDYSRFMDDATKKRNGTEEWHRKLTAWKAQIDTNLTAKGLKFDEATGEVVEINPTRKAPNGDPNPNPEPPAVDLSGFVRKEDVNRQISEAVQAANTHAYSVSAYLTQLAGDHYKEFDEVLNQAELAVYCRDHNLAVDKGGYAEYVRSKRDARAAKVAEDALKAAEEKGYKRALQEQGSALPYPVSTGGESGALLGLDPTYRKDTLGITDKNNKPDGSAVTARAVRTYHEEMRKRSGAA
jgi:hypothetical protein